MNESDKVQQADTELAPVTQEELEAAKVQLELPLEDSDHQRLLNKLHELETEIDKVWRSIQALIEAVAELSTRAGLSRSSRNCPNCGRRAFGPVCAFCSKRIA